MPVYLREKGATVPLSPAKPPAEQGGQGRLGQTIQSPRPTANNEDGVQRTEIKIRRKNMHAEDSTS